MGRNFNDITGLKFDKFLVIERYKSDKNDLYWKCKCDCGEICYATSTNLKRGRKNFCKKCSKENSENSPIRLLYGNYKRNAIKRNLNFELSIDDFKNLISLDCFYCGTKPQQIYYKKGMLNNLIYNGIDRRNNDFGYIIKNCVTACKYCNLAKKNFKESDFINWINNIKNNGR